MFVDRAEIASTLELCKGVYEEACMLLPRFIRPTGGAYASESDVRLAELVDVLAARFPDEPRDLLEIAGSYCVYYQYLR